MILIIELVKRAQKGDGDAFLKLYQEYENEIYRTAYIYVKNIEDALDIVQEVAYRSFKMIKTLKDPEYFKTWLIKISINCSINLLKKNKKEVQLKPGYEEFIGTKNEDIPLTLTLQRLIDNLNEIEKSVVILRFYYNYTFKEIAQLLDMPLGTTKTVLYKSLEKLRKNYKAENGDAINE